MNNSNQGKKKNILEIMNKYEGTQPVQKIINQSTNPKFQGLNSFNNKAIGTQQTKTYYQVNKGSQPINNNYQIDSKQKILNTSKNQTHYQKNGKQMISNQNKFNPQQNIKKIYPNPKSGTQIYYNRNQLNKTPVKSVNQVYSNKGKYSTPLNGSYRRRGSGNPETNKSTPRYNPQNKNKKNQKKKNFKNAIENRLNRSGKSRSGNLNASKSSRSHNKKNISNSKISIKKSSQRKLRKNSKSIKPKNKKINPKSEFKPAPVISKNTNNQNKKQVLKTNSKIIPKTPKQQNISNPRKIKQGSQTNVSGSLNDIGSLKTFVKQNSNILVHQNNSPNLPINTSKKKFQPATKNNNQAGKNPEPVKKRNFSPIQSGQINQNGQKLFEQNLKKAGEPKEDNDSLGGGSKINVKNGSIMNFGAGSRIADNMSVMSKYNL